MLEIFHYDILYFANFPMEMLKRMDNAWVK